MRRCRTLHLLYDEYRRLTRELASACASADFARVTRLIERRDDMASAIDRQREDIPDPVLTEYPQLENMQQCLLEIHRLEREVTRRLQSDVKSVAEDAAEASRRRMKTASYQKNRQVRKRATAYDRRG